jgi:hypothetical protein
MHATQFNRGQFASIAIALTLFLSGCAENSPTIDNRSKRIDSGATKSRVASQRDSIPLESVASTPLFSGTPAEMELKRGLYENFGVPGWETSWYPHIKDVKITNDAVIVTSDLPRGNSTLKGICAGLSSFIYANGSTLPKVLIIVKADGQELAIRRSIAHPCELQ